MFTAKHTSKQTRIFKIPTTLFSSWPILLHLTRQMYASDWRNGRDCPQGLAFHVGEIVAALDAFPEAQPYFAAEFMALKQWSQGPLTETEGLHQTLQTLAGKIVY